MLQPQSFTINFAQGLDTKTDPKQIQVGKFLVLENSVFTEGNLLKKRNGYAAFTEPVAPNAFMTTLNGNLVSIGSTVNAYSSSLESWITKGHLEPCGLTVLPLIRNNLNQIQSDTVILNGMVLTTYTSVNDLVNQYYYAIADAVTGQNIVEPTLITPIAGGTISGSSRVFAINNLFVIVSQVIVSATTSLQYSYIPSNNPVNLTTNVPNVSAPVKVVSDTYAAVTANPGWDGVVTEDTLIIAYNTTTGGQAVHVAQLTEAQIFAHATTSTIFSFAGYTANSLSICYDSYDAVYYVTFNYTSSSDTYTGAVKSPGPGAITLWFAPTLVFNNLPMVQMATAAQNGICTIFGENPNLYEYDDIPSNYIEAVTITSAAVVGTPYVSIRSLGLASKAFIIDGTIYYLGAYQSIYQPTYFLINGTLSTEQSPIITAKLAYENGGGYVTLGLPSVTVTGNVAQISYLFKDLVEALNTLNNTQQTTAGGIYSQTGVNLISFELGTEAIDSADIGSNLHITGGYLSHFDGYLPVEHNFFLWPDSVEATWIANSIVTPTGTWSNASNTIVVSSAGGISPGMTITDTTNPSYIPPNTSVLKVIGTTLTLSNPTTHAASGDSLSIQGNIAARPNGEDLNTDVYYYQVTYEWSDNQGLIYRSAPSIPVAVTTAGSGTTGIITIDVPTLRVTQKVANPVKIVIYRWSVETEVYNQVTSITAPILNDTTIDSVTFVDTLSDADVIGNNIIYTTGGVVENVNAPACNGIMTLFDTRLWLVDAEDPNVLWPSKQVIENTPVEMSDLFTIYIAPNTGTVASTGPIKALAPMDDKIIIFKGSAIYYINGVGPNNLGTTSVGCPLGNYSQPTFITSIVGCTNQQSIVLTQDGLMFQSDKGIWLLSRALEVSYIGAPVEEFNSATVTSANVIPETNFVLFTLDSGPFLMYDYFYAQWGTFVGTQAATSSCIYNGLHTVLNKYGQILQETPGFYLDGSNPVLIGLTSGHIQFQGISGYQALFEIQLLGQYFSPHLLDFQLGYDFGALSEQVLIQPTNYTGVYGSDSLYGMTSPFGGPSQLEQWRIQPSTQNCQAFQISIQEVYDPSFGAPAGAGFTLSAMTVTLGLMKGYRPVKAANTVGTS